MSSSGVPRALSRSGGDRRRDGGPAFAFSGILHSDRRGAYEWVDAAATAALLDYPLRQLRESMLPFAPTMD